MIKYLGSKRTLLPLITQVIGECCPPGSTILDLFSGTSRVGHALKALNYRVIANDHNAYAHALAACYVQADAEDVAADAAVLIDELNTIQGSAGYFTQTFCLDARYIHPRNGERIDAIRESIAARALPPELESVLLVSLMEAADRVDSTTGLQMAYLKVWAPRAHRPLVLRLPNVLPRSAAGRCEARRGDAFAAAQVPAAVAYIDPPYNQHSYLGNYHVWESLVTWDKPPVYGLARKRTDVRERTSIFNSRVQFEGAFERLISMVAAPMLVVSFSDEGFISRERAEQILATRGSVRTFDRPYRRYIGAQIGIHNPAGEKVGAVTHLRNTEYVFVVS